jgi:hypothetical protein
MIDINEPADEAPEATHDDDEHQDLRRREIEHGRYSII